MHDNFELAHSFTARWEGGLSDNPADPGGLTNYGLSLRFVRDLAAQARAECRGASGGCANCANRAAGRDCPAALYDLDGDGDVDSSDIRACTAQAAALLFRKHFWDALACSRLPAPLACVLYDAAVNMGAPRAVRQVQRAMNAVGESELEPYAPIAEDGLMGPKTLALAQALDTVCLTFYTARRVLALRDAFYRDLAARRPSMKVFLNGWRNRVKDLGDFLAQLEREGV